MNNEFIESIKTYLKGVRAEWGKITWLEKNQVIAETVFVSVIIITFTIAVYVMDLIFKLGLHAITNK